MRKYLIAIVLLLSIVLVKAQTVNTKSNPTDTTVYADVEEQAHFAGGVEEFSNFISENLKYPNSARETNTQGRVIIQLIIEKDGSLTNLHVLKGLTSDINAEALRVMRASPKWMPAKTDNKIVRSLYTFPMSFKLNFSTPNKSEVFSVVGVSAEFPGGIEKLYQYITKNLKNPGGDNGKVRISFVVEKDGSLTDIKIVGSLSETADAEAIRLMKASPKWKPAMQNDAPVRQLYNIPISFIN
ncbi:MAG: energy transducer TonB [Bacteroidota bacterium]